MVKLLCLQLFLSFVFTAETYGEPLAPTVPPTARVPSSGYKPPARPSVPGPPLAQITLFFKAYDARSNVLIIPFLSSRISETERKTLLTALENEFTHYPRLRSHILKLEREQKGDECLVSVVLNGDRGKYIPPAKGEKRYRIVFSNEYLEAKMKWVKDGAFWKIDSFECAPSDELKRQYIQKTINIYQRFTELPPSPDTAVCLNKLAWAYYRLGNYAAAARAAQQSFNGSDNLKARWLYAQSLRKAGKTDEAISAMKEIKTHFPGSYFEQEMTNTIQKSEQVLSSKNRRR